MEKLEAARVLVVGLGESGLAAARLAAADGAAVVVTDRRDEADLGTVLDGLPAGDYAFPGRSPRKQPRRRRAGGLVAGRRVRHAAGPSARGRGLPVLSELEFAWRHRVDAPLVAVTGSNGKSTVTTLIAHMLDGAGRRAVAGGNLGPAASQLVLDGGWHAWVLEVSSFQAETLVELRPDVGVFLNLSQDHLERHPDIESYAAAKRRLFVNQGPSDVRVLNADDAMVAATGGQARARYFSLAETADACLDGDELVIDGKALMLRSDLALSGLHNVANGCAAGLAAAAMGASRQAIRSTLETFTGLPHRHRVVHEAGGVRWVDDSKATNVGAALAALSGYPEASVHLILGGLGKGQDFTPLAEAVRRVAARVYLIGRDGPAIGAALRNGAPLETCTTLERAVGRIREEAVSGQVVVLAPACASFDQFSGYPERGQRFADLARAERGPACP